MIRSKLTAPARIFGGSLAALVALAACANEAAPIDAPPANESDVTAPPGASKQAPAPAASAQQANDRPPAAQDVVVHSLANIGDSISQAFDADDDTPLDTTAALRDPQTVFKDDPALSWVQGTDARVASVAAHYLALDPKLEVTPVSRSGAELVLDFELQARQIAKQGRRPDLVYVLLGGNDICDRPRSTADDATATLYPIEKWRDAVDKGLAAFAETLPAGATVRVLSMPRVDFLYSAAENLNVSVKATVDTPAGPVKVDSTASCKDVWAIAAAAKAGVCPIITTETSAARRAAIGARIDAYNDALANEVRRFAGDANLNPNKIAFQTDWNGSIASGAAPNSSLGTFVFEAQHISRRDCFHPNIAGQNAIASLVLGRKSWTP